MTVSSPFPTPPNPEDAAYKNNPMGYNKAMYQWASLLTQKVQQNVKQYNTPLDQNFVLGSYTVGTALSGTSTGTDVANALCSLLASMIRRGTVSPTLKGNSAS
jgi:hypothetical protein